MAPDTLLFEEELRGGASFAHVLKRGTALRITDLQGGANVPVTLLNFELLVERYNMPDTLKAQHTAHLTRGHCLYSDMGRVLCSIVEDTVGWHDPIGAHSTDESVKARFGERSYQEFRNDWYTSTRGNFLRELAKFGLDRRDLQGHINFFSKVQVDEEGGLHFVPGNSRAGDEVVLRAEMNVLVILDANPHPLDPNPNYDPKPVRLRFEKVAAPGPDDYCRNFCPENQRGFINTERYFL
jgi:urea carboxylase-associated protein 2